MPLVFQLKTYELSGRIFEDEYDLAMAVIDGREKRSKKNNFGKHSAISHQLLLLVLDKSFTN
ncbi:MAG: hypothetical protein F6K39_12105 [Okeania sp. SIO3B3]|nr:hypothetical protein [Okeania sp. SIO3B3]